MGLKAVGTFCCDYAVWYTDQLHCTEVFEEIKEGTGIQRSRSGVVVGEWCGGGGGGGGGGHLPICASSE